MQKPQKQTKVSFQMEKSSPFNRNLNSIQKPNKENQNSLNSGVTLKDLCAEDKAKIGELMRKLAEEKQQKEELLQALEKKHKLFEESLLQIRKENEQVAMESHELKQKFKQSIDLIKTFQKKDGENRKDNFSKETIKSPIKEKIMSETERYFVFKPEISKKKQEITKTFSPKREILSMNAGESERKLYNLTKFPPNEKNIKNEENMTNAKNIENQQEIEKLKEEIDNLAISLQKLKPESPYEKSSPKKNMEIKVQDFSKKMDVENTMIKAKSPQYFQGLDKLKKESPNKKQLITSPAINIIDNYLQENDENELEEEIQLTKKWMSKKTESNFKSPSQKPFSKLPEISDYNKLSQNSLSNLRSYLDKKLEVYSKEVVVDSSFPTPQKLQNEPMQLREPEFIENSEVMSTDKKCENNEDEERLMDYIKNSIKREVENSLKGVDFKEVFEEKMKEYLHIKKRVLGEEEDLTKQKILLEKETKKDFKPNSKKKPNLIAEKQEKLLKIDEISIKKPENLNENLSFTKEKKEKISHFEGNFQEEEEINDLLKNYNDDFYENNLFDLIDELDQKEFARKTKPNEINKEFLDQRENKITFQRTESSYEMENQNYANVSYTETDASIRYIKKQILEMEESKTKPKKPFY